MNILISGGAGYIGSFMVKEFLNRYLSANITVIDNLMYNQDGLIPFCNSPNFEFVYGDVRNEKLLDKWVDWADIVIPLAALVGFPACERDPSYAKQVNTDHVCHIANKTRNTNKRLIAPNTNSGYGVGQDGIYCTEETPLNPISVYGITKCKAEEAVLQAGGISLRLATVFGISPRMRLDLLVNNFVYKAVTDGYIVLFEKDFKRNYIHIFDVINAFCFMIGKYDEYCGQTFNVGLSNANLSKWELCLKIKEYLPKFSIQIDEIHKDIDQRNYIVSNSKLENAGWKPKMTLNDGIKELIKAYQIITNVSQKYSNA